MAEKKKGDYIFASGKRKAAVARLRLYSALSGVVIGTNIVKKGDIFVNGKKAEEYFSDKVSQMKINEPLKITNTTDKYAISVKLEGGGVQSQLDEFVHAISRALSSIDDKNKAILRKKGFLTRDARVRERRKVGMGGKARRQKQSPKR